jgi:hypothetical protein
MLFTLSIWGSFQNKNSPCLHVSATGSRGADLPVGKKHSLELIFAQIPPADICIE